MLSGEEEGEETQAGYEEGWYDEDQTQYDMSIRSESTHPPPPPVIVRAVDPDPHGSAFIFPS